MRRPEQQLQKAVVAHLRARMPKPWLVWATPNGGGRSKAEAGVQKAMGVMAGIPDLFVLGPLENGRMRVRSPRLIAIELKAPPHRLKSGGISKAAVALSPAQKETIAALGECGVPTLVVRSIDDLEAGLRGLGVPLRGAVTL